MTMTPSQAVAYLHGTAPANSDDHRLSKRYEACAALAPLVGRTDLDAEFARVGRVYFDDNDAHTRLLEDDDSLWSVSEDEALYVRKLAVQSIKRDQSGHTT